jgi:putative zinc finger/helix-turn-helix YgiT family protein
MVGEICPVCGHGNLRAAGGTYETRFLDRQGQAHELKVPDIDWTECDQCGEVFLDEAASQVVEAARRKALGLLTPQEIRNLRLSLGKTQKQMSAMLGVGEKTYCRWESGAYVQSTASDRYLRLLVEVPENIRVLERLEAGETDVVDLMANEEPTFMYLSDLDSLQARADAFTRQLECGQLYSAASAGSV